MLRAFAPRTRYMDESSSTPIWVPIVVGAIGLVGVLLSALVTQWLAGRRAAEERRAADAREERQRQDVREAREGALQWDETMRKYELRREAYATLALSLRRWVDVMQAARGSRTYANPPDEEQKEALRVVETATKEAGASVDLLGSKPVRAAYRTTWARMSLTALHIRSRYKTNEDVDKSWSSAMSAYWRLMDFLRIDLGIDPENAEMTEKYRELEGAKADSSPAGTPPEEPLSRP